MSRASILILAPVGRDGALLCSALERSGLHARDYDDAEALAADLHDDAGVLVITGEALTAAEPIERVLREQPAWSDIPVILLMGGSSSRRSLTGQKSPLLRAATVLERPVQMPTLISVVNAAIRARNRQQEVRSLLQELKDLNSGLEERVSRRTAEVRDLSAALTLAEQQERQRISDLLHDHLQQLLFAMRLQLQLITPTDEDQSQNAHSHLGKLIDEAMQLTRTLSVELHPPVLLDDGLALAVQWAVSQMRDQHDLNIEFHSDSNYPLTSREMMILLTRSVRELLFNVVKHAKASHVDVLITDQDGFLELSVSDDGVGFELSNVDGQKFTGKGLRALRERLNLLGGEMVTDSIPGGGTSITMRVPLSTLHAPVPAVRV